MAAYEIERGTTAGEPNARMDCESQFVIFFLSQEAKPMTNKFCLSSRRGHENVC